MNKKLISSVVAGLLLSTNSAWAFKVNFKGSGNVGITKPIHENITYDALKDITIYFPNGQKAMLKDSITDRIKSLASYNDEYGLDDGTLHFDDSRLEESARRIEGFIHKDAKTHYLDGGSKTEKGYGTGKDYQFVLDIAQAMHTTQDFFAHSTWVETNIQLGAFETDYRLKPFVIKKLPYPKLGIESNPFGPEFSSPSGVEVLDDNPNNTLNDDTHGGCNKAEYKPMTPKLTSAYYDYGMSLPLVNLGYSTTAWNGRLKEGVLIPQRISWPEQRCVHGGDKNTKDLDGYGGDGINKDKESRRYHDEAKQSAIEASRNLMLEFLRVSGATTVAGQAYACEMLFKCTEISKPTVYDIKLEDIPSTILTELGQRQLWGFFMTNGLPVSLLAVSFNGLACEIAHLDGNGKHAFACPSTYKGKGTLKIYQKANPTLVLHQVDNFSVNPEIIIDHSPASGLTGVIGICTFCESLVSHGVITAYDINWGDGKLENFVMGIQDVQHKHAYTSEGTKTVVITFKDKFGRTFEEARTINVSKSVMAIQGGTTQQAGQAAVFSMEKVFSDATSVFWRFFNSIGDAIQGFLKSVSEQVSLVFEDSGDYKAVAEVRSDQGLLETVEQIFSVKGKVNIDTTFNDPTFENLYEVQKIGLDTSDGTLRLPLNVGEVDSTFPYIWIANSGEGTISKLATRDHYRKNPQTGEQELVKTGQELGRYRTGPGNGNPSRTTVDQEGNVWVGNRNNNTITKVGLFEFGNCIDRNGNGKIDTSIGGTDVKDWSGYFGDGQGAANAQDECVLQHVALYASGVSTPIDIRTIAIDKDNNVFVGGHQTSSIFKVDGSTGQIIKANNTNGSFYGGLVDKEGNLWAASRYFHGVGRVLKVSSDLSTSEVIDAGIPVYGIALDKYGKIWVTDAYSTAFATFNPADVAGTKRTFNQEGRLGGLSCYAQGIAVDDNDNIFIAGSACQNDAIVGHYKQVVNGDNTSVQLVANYHVSSGPTGVAVDGKGNVWSSDLTNNSVSQITLDASNPANAKVNTFTVGLTPYNYSDMTGRTVRNTTNRQGTWEAIFDGATPEQLTLKLS